MTNKEAYELLHEMQQNCNLPTSLDPKRFEKSYALEIAMKASDRPMRTGKWIYDKEVSKHHVEPMFICTACKDYWAWGTYERTPYCPNCGASMKNEEYDNAD